MSKIMENAKNRFKARIRAKIETKTINGTFKSIKTFYCNGIIFGKTKCYFFGNNGKRYQFLNSSIVSVDQCTGLKDKNSKLIYEADIAKDRWGNIKEVEFCSGCFCWGVEEGTYWGSGSLEVIGNIYENEDLLND